MLSAYQFAVDVAAKGVLHLDPAKKTPARRSDFVGTLEVWPWSYLIPWFKRDMAARVRQAAGRRRWGGWLAGRARCSRCRGPLLPPPSESVRFLEARCYGQPPLHHLSPACSRLAAACGDARVC